MVDDIDIDRVFLLGGDRIGLLNFGSSCTAISENNLFCNFIYFLYQLASTKNYLHAINLENGTEEVQWPFRDKGFRFH
jgi:hypothetical protein